MSPKEALLEDIKIGTVTLLTHLKDSYVVRYCGLMFTIGFDENGDVLSFDTKDIQATETSATSFINKRKGVFNLHVVNVTNPVIDDMVFLYIEPINPKPWMIKNISSLPQFWWCVQRVFSEDDLSHNRIFSKAKLLSTTRFYTRVVGEEAVEIKDGGGYDFTTFKTEFKS